MRLGYHALSGAGRECGTNSRDMFDRTQADGRNCYLPRSRSHQRESPLIKSVAIGLLASVLVGCASKGLIEGNAGLPSQNESVLVVGVTPANNHILFFPGAVKNGVFVQNNFKGSPLFGRPSEGFLVGKVAAGQTLGLTTVQVTPFEKSLAFAKQFTPCGEAKTFVLQVPRGKVVYLGSVVYDFQQERLLVRHGNDIAAAQAHLAKNYPTLAPALEYSAFELMATSKECSSGEITIPVYVPNLLK